MATIGGLLGGTVAVHGLRQNHYGPITASAPFGQRDSDIGSSNEASTASSCEGCSERDLGYRWAVLASVRSSDQCPNDSWGFRRGCIDYTGGV